MEVMSGRQLYIILMIEEEQEVNAFSVSPMELREPSINVSLMTSTYSYRNTYQQLHHHFKGYLSDKIDLNALQRSPNLRIKKYKESVYFGEFKDGKREGLGIMIYNNGKVYEGSWKNDLRHGQGFEKLNNGCVYEGQFQNGNPHGQGKLTWPNGQVYEGEWSNNLKHGTGLWKNERGDTYLGEWRDDQATGFGVFTEAQGDRYEGSFVNFVKEGEGMEHFARGDLYKGNYKQGKFDGYGEFYWKDGQYYKGNFSRGLRNGQGVWKGKAGVSDKYEGEFKDNKKDGFGIYTFASGKMYKGNYRNNMCSGYGEMYFEDGSFYRGDWELDKENGQGEYFSGNGKLERGYFIDGELVEPEHSEEQSSRMIDYDVPPISSFDHRYTVPRRHMHYGDQNITESEEQKMKATVPYFYRDDEARVVKSKLPARPKKGQSPLVQESFLRKKLMNTLQFKHNVPAYSIGHGQNIKKKVESRASSRDTVPHSAFQIHRIHRNRVISSGGAVDTSFNTLDNAVKFAFRDKASTERPRYHSRLS